MSLKVDILYWAAPNVRQRDGKPDGWVPLISTDGRQQGHTYWPMGLDKEEAQLRACEMAQEEAARYIGDHQVWVEAKR